MLLLDGDSCSGSVGSTVGRLPLPVLDLDGGLDVAPRSSEGAADAIREEVAIEGMPESGVREEEADLEIPEAVVDNCGADGISNSGGLVRGVA